MGRREYKSSQTERRKITRNILSESLRHIQKDNTPKNQIQKGAKITLYEYIFVDKMTANDAIEKITSNNVYDRKVCLEWLKDKQAIKTWMNDRLKMKKTKNEQEEER